MGTRIEKMIGFGLAKPGKYFDFNMTFFEKRQYDLAVDYPYEYKEKTRFEDIFHSDWGHIHDDPKKIEYILFLPDTGKDNYRYDNHMDSYEFFLTHKKMKTVVKPLQDKNGEYNCIYPWINLMKGDSPETFEKYWEPCYMDLKEKHIPYVPDHILKAIEAADMVDDPFKLYMSLRPMIVIDWN